MKPLVLLIISFAAISQAKAITFEAYKDALESDLVCADYPNIDEKMHLQLLKETGAINAGSSLGRADKEYKFMIGPGYQIFGLPLKSISLFPRGKDGRATISAVVASAPNITAAAIKRKADKSFGGPATFNFGIYSWTYYWRQGDDPAKDKGGELTVSREQQSRGSIITCDLFRP